MTFRECVLRAYHFHGGRADNEQVFAYVADRRPEPRAELHYPLIPRVVQSLKNSGLLENVVRGRWRQVGVWRLTPAGRQAAQSMFGPN